MAIANKLRRKIFGINWNDNGGNDDKIDKKLNSKIDKKLKRKLEKHKKK
jgi:hypothetical protein